jgi:hypothetical protein
MFKNYKLAKWQVEEMSSQRNDLAPFRRYDMDMPIEGFKNRK